MLQERRLARSVPLLPVLLRARREGYFRLGEYSRAVEAANLAISQAKEHGTLDRVESAFEVRAEAREKLGQYGEALTDVQEAIALVERVRSDVVPPTR